MRQQTASGWKFAASKSKQEKLATLRNALAKPLWYHNFLHCPVVRYLQVPMSGLKWLAGKCNFHL